MERQTLLRTIYNYNATADNCRYYDLVRKNQVDTACKDIVQEFQRLRIRNFPKSEDPAELRKYGISVLWFSRGHAQGSYDPERETLSEEIVRRILAEFECDANRNYVYHAPVLNEYRNDDKAPAMIIEYYKGLKTGAEYTQTGISRDLNLHLDTIKQTFARNKILKNLTKNDTVECRGKYLIHIKAGSEKEDLARVIRSYRKYDYADKYTHADIAKDTGVAEEFVWQAFEFNSELKKLTRFDTRLADGWICENPEKEEIVRAEAYVEKTYRETPRGGKYSPTTSIF